MVTTSASSVTCEPSKAAYALDTLEIHVGREIGVSPWLAVDQASIDAFGRVTLDADPNHMDPTWATEHSPFGRTVAFGFQTLAYLTYLGKQAGMIPEGVTDAVNYGIERTRFVEPVPAAARIRARVTLKGVRRRGDGAALATFAFTIEIDGVPRPAVVGDWLTLLSSAKFPHG